MPHKKVPVYTKYGSHIARMIKYDLSSTEAHVNVLNIPKHES